MQPALCSYLDYPRIHFARKFRVDTNAINNDHCNFRMDTEIDAKPVIHNFGSNSFQFFDTEITSVVFENGKKINLDPLVTKKIVNNVNRPFAKLVDLDVDCQMHSTIYGMDFGIKGEKGFILYGNWTPAIIAQNMWPRVACFTDKNNCVLDRSPGGETFSAQSTTTLENIEWHVESGGFIDEFKKAFDKSGKTNLAIRITLSAYSYGGNDAELGSACCWRDRYPK